MTDEIMALETRLAELEYEKNTFPPAEASNDDFMLILEIAETQKLLNVELFNIGVK